MQRHRFCPAVVRGIPDAFRRCSVRSASWIHLYTICMLLCAMTGISHAQVVQPASLNPRLDDLFTQGEFEHVEIEALRILRSATDASENDQLAAYLYLGFVEVLTSRDQEAAVDFHKALELRPSLMLDPVYVPPRVYQAFEEVRIEYMATLFKLDQETSTTPTIMIQKEPVARGMAGAANMIIPGSGFWMEKRRLRGTTWFVLQSASVSMLVYSLMETENARDRYMETSRPDLFQERYEKYNTWYQRSWTWGIVSAVVYVSAQLDFHFSPGAPRLEPAVLGSPENPEIGLRLVMPIR